LRPRPGGEAGYLEWDEDRWSFALLRVWVGRAACGWGVMQAFEMWARGWGVMGLVRAFEIWARQAALIGTLAKSPHRQQFECEWCAQGWCKDGMGCENPAKGRFSRVFPCVESVRGWHQRGRYEAVPGEAYIDLDPQPNPVQAYCGRCKQVRSVWAVRGEEEYRYAEWMDDEDQPVMLQVPEAIRCDVQYLKDKSAVQWKEVWARRAQAKAAIKADNAVWMREGKLAQRQVDALTNDESVNLGWVGECGY